MTIPVNENKDEAYYEEQASQEDEMKLTPLGSRRPAPRPQ